MSDLPCTHEHLLYATQPFPPAVGRGRDEDDQGEHPCCGDHDCVITMRFFDKMVDVSDLVGQIDIAEMLGVGATAVGNWRHRKVGMPEPLVIINKNTALFSRSAIMKWAKETGRWGR